MAAISQSQVPHQEEKTFRTFSTTAAAQYNQYRGSWPDSFNASLVAQHTAAGGDTGLLLDVGCGPGNSTRSLAQYFQRVIGVDPSPSMIETARSIACLSASGENVRFEAGKAEDLSGISALTELSPSTQGTGSVDVITAATAAHWFDLPPFWVEAAKVLKPGGSVIFWCSGGLHVSFVLSSRGHECAALPEGSLVQRFGRAS